jgi:hypothetical protein
MGRVSGKAAVWREEGRKEGEGGGDIWSTHIYWITGSFIFCSSEEGEKACT